MAFVYRERVCHPALPMLVPGVSGGTMAMLLDIYDELISAVSSFLDDKKENSALLLLFTLGGFRRDAAACPSHPLADPDISVSNAVFLYGSGHRGGTDDLRKSGST